jgi:hypothetical protein
MNKKMVKIERKGNKLFVEVGLPIYTRQNNTKKIKYKTSDILSYVKALGNKVEKCIVDPGPVYNSKSEHRTKTWIFELKVPVKKAPTKRKSQEKVKKSLDKSSESVIIEVEKKSSPSSYKKRSSFTEE